MTTSKPARIAWLVLGAALVAATAAPLAAETRSCAGELSIAPQNAAQSWLRYNFSVHRQVDGIRYNQAREEASARMIACLRDHWELRELDHRPDNCVSKLGYEFHGYPFEALEAEVTDALCTANPEAQTIVIGIDLRISGQRDCDSHGSHVRIAQNAMIDCRPPITDGGMDEVHEEGPVFRDAGSSECVGEGCPGAGTAEEAEGADEAMLPEEDEAPAAATYRPLPAIRLPGNDLYLIELDAPNWLLCRQACTEDSRCGAWTYRGPTAASGPLCLIKSRAGVPIPDFCCRSGIKQ